MTAAHLQTFRLMLAFAALGAAAALLLVMLAPRTWRALRRLAASGKVQAALFGMCIIGFAHYGATFSESKKGGSRIGYDGGIKAGATANVVSNDIVCIYWQRDTASGAYVPETAAVYIDYRPNTETNADWGLLAQTIVGAWGWSGRVPNATNYDYNVWAYYIPPEPVHTNGVWTYKTQYGRQSDFPIPLRVRVEINGKAIATPKEARKDEENDN